MKNTEVKIRILAKDIRKNTYTDHKTCAITLAVKRAGIEGYHDPDTNIRDENGGLIGKITHECHDKVRRMYAGLPVNKDSMWKKDLEEIGKKSLVARDFTTVLTLM